MNDVPRQKDPPNRTKIPISDGGKNTKITKWPGAFIVFGIIIVILILMNGISERSVSNFYLVPAGIFSPYHAVNNETEQHVIAQSSLAGDGSPGNQKLVDTHFEVLEWNLSFIHNMSIIHVTYDDLKEFPDFERSMHGVNQGTGDWHSGYRLVDWFEGNMSDRYRFNAVVCKNKPLDECFAKPPVFEYHGQYYYIIGDSYGYHRLAGCERGNYNCTR